MRKSGEGGEKGGRAKMGGGGERGGSGDVKGERKERRVGREEK